MAAAVRVRFAPSPTGYLHVGGARTALFNWLFARHHGGKFILRIEDTDFTRSSSEMVEGILQGMRWLGLDWDDGPIYQSQWIERYQAFAGRLLANGTAYRCFCKPEEKAPHKDARKADARFGSRDCGCFQLTPDESESRAQSGGPFAVRFRVARGMTAYHDRVFGDIEVDHAHIEDFVLLRSDGVPTYHLSVVVDDLDMGITNVIRGADHISNTAKQILLYQAAGEPLPEFAHLPLILGPDRQRLSKRHGATSVMAYAAMGYLPEAFVNFLAFLGWSPGDDREILSSCELIELFSLEGVGKANAVFCLDKLDWFNSQYLQSMPEEAFCRLVAGELVSRGIWPKDSPAREGEGLATSIRLLKTRARRLSDFSSTFKGFFTDDYSYETRAAEKFLGDSRLKELLPILLERYENDPSFSLESTEGELRRLAENSGIKAGLLINALRVGLTGQGVAPGLFEVMQALGRIRTLDRIRRLVAYLSGAS